MQFPKELRHVEVLIGGGDAGASMKCSSRRNCDNILISRRREIHTLPQ